MRTPRSVRSSIAAIAWRRDGRTKLQSRYGSPDRDSEGYRASWRCSRQTLELSRFPSLLQRCEEFIPSHRGALQDGVLRCLLAGVSDLGVAEPFGCLSRLRPVDVRSIQ